MGSCNASEDWTIVLRRKGKTTNGVNRAPRELITLEQPKEERPWTPNDVETHTVERELALLQKMHNCIQKIENTEFWSTFLRQLQSPELSERFLKVLGSEEKMTMVIYGIGSIENYDPPRMQLSLAILIKRNFEWIGEIEVFDPVISFTESKVLASLGCHVLSVNEQGRRQVLRPTIFFMPHCEAELYENLLEANWGVDQLMNISLFGNSFDMQEEYVSVCGNPNVANMRRHILAARSFGKEFGVNKLSDDSFRAFHGSSWHFFSPISEADLHIGNNTSKP